MTERKTKAFKIGNDEFIAQELTVSQVQQILDGETGQIDMVDLLFPDRIPAEAVALSLGITRKELADKDYPPSVLEKILTEVELVNPIFAGLIQRLATIGRAAMMKSAGRQPG